MLVEVDGGIYMARSGHNTGNSIQRDREKDLLAAERGWLMFRICKQQIGAEKAKRLIDLCLSRQVIETGSAGDVYVMQRTMNKNTQKDLL